MPDWTPQLLLFVFTTHMPFFAWRWWRTRELRYAATTVTFSLLIVAYSIRVFAPDLAIGDVSLFWVARIPAWSAAVVSIGLLVRHHVRRLRGSIRFETARESDTTESSIR